MTSENCDHKYSFDHMIHIVKPVRSEREIQHSTGIYVRDYVVEHPLGAVYRSERILESWGQNKLSK